MKLYRSMSGICLAVLVAALAACGGGGTENQSVWQAASRSDAGPARLVTSLNATIIQTKSLDATTLFDWAESRYPELFPKGPVNQTEVPYLYRYYPATKLYLGASGDEVLWMGPNTDNKIVSLGKISDYTCFVFPEVCNFEPVANSGVAQNVAAGSAVTLDGSASSDANSDSLSYAWTLTTKPAGSTAVLSSTTLARPTFVADVVGTYVASLVVNDGKSSSGNSTTTITAASTVEILLSATAPHDNLLAVYPTLPTTAGSSLCGYQVGSQRIYGTVTKVYDGDTVTIGSQNIRLDSIDAPELAQTFGRQAQKTLETLVLGKPVTVAFTKLDKYGRTVGAVFTSDCTYANLRQVAIGSAWFYRAYQCEVSAVSRNAFAAAEDAAIAADLGMWAQAATPPWVYRNGVSPDTPSCTASTPVWAGNLVPTTPVLFTPPLTSPNVTAAAPSTTGGCYKVWVNAYTRANGTRVAGYYRNSPGCA